MKFFKQAGSKDRLVEMFKVVNKVDINESFDVPKEKDKKYLNKLGDEFEDGVTKHDENDINVNEDLLKGGSADNIDDSEFNTRELEDGLEHEMEHTDNKDIAKEIAKDHITDEPDYYDNLEESDDKEMDKLTDPSEHWIDHYKPMNVGEMNEDGNPMNLDTKMEILNMLEMGYSRETGRISSDVVDEIVASFDVDEDVVYGLANNVVDEMAGRNHNQFSDDIKDYVNELNRQDVDLSNYSSDTIWDGFDSEYNYDNNYKREDFEREFKKMTTDPNQLEIFDDDKNEVEYKSAYDK